MVLIVLIVISQILLYVYAAKAIEVEHSINLLINVVQASLYYHEIINSVLNLS